ncbi:capsule biosynthesis protein [Methylocella sp.]|uniref:capsule biosynthesis protein n=1 Tax=Methylocella sp. TaxID=1978226 RepID=UPI0037833B99
MASESRALQTRHFLFLQGNSSRLFARLRHSLLERGAGVHRINFCCADHLFWGSLRHSSRYAGSLEDWPAWFARFIEARRFTDVLLFGDCRPYHRPAALLARRAGLAVHVFEEGYLRPNWITMERGGVNGFSPLPRDPRRYMAEAALGGEPEERPAAQSFAERVALDLAFHVANAPTRLFYPRFTRHRPASPLAEARGWAGRLARGRRERRATVAALDALRGAGSPYFLFPLQLDADSQIRSHSPFASMWEACALTLRSFADHAPADAALVVKLHPLDNGLSDYRRLLRALARERGVEARVVFVDGGDLAALIEGSRGVVTVNSTVGLMALRQGRAVKCLGSAIYDLPGLAHQGGLDGFWTAPATPDARLAAAFSRIVKRRAQINGGYFGARALDLAVEGVLGRLLGAAPERALLGAAPERAPQRVEREEAELAGAAAQ